MACPIHLHGRNPNLFQFHRLHARKGWTHPDPECSRSTAASGRPPNPHSIRRFMAGHNKWSKVKHIKARVDAVKGRVFSKCSHEIALAARAGGGDPGANAQLRTAIDNAKSVSMPKDNIERAIKKGTGELGGEAIQEVMYEGYGPEGIAFMVVMATDNLNRSAADVRSIFAKNLGSVATQGSVSFQFDHKGEVRVPAESLEADRLLEVAIEAGADDAFSEEVQHVLLTAPQQLAAVAQSLRDAGLNVASEKLVYLPQNPSVVTDASVARRVLRLHDQLDDYADTVAVFTNFDVADEILDQLEE